MGSEVKYDDIVPSLSLTHGSVCELYHAHMGCRGTCIREKDLERAHGSEGLQREETQKCWVFSFSVQLILEIRVNWGQTLPRKTETNEP